LSCLTFGDLFELNRLVWLFLLEVLFIVFSESRDWSIIAEMISDWRGRDIAVVCARTLQMINIKSVTTRSARRRG